MCAHSRPHSDYSHPLIVRASDVRLVCTRATATHGMAEARTHLQRDAVEDQIAELDRFPDEERAAVAQQHRDGDPERLHREEEQQAPRADRHHHAVNEARRLAVQPSDGTGRRESAADIVDDLLM